VRRLGEWEKGRLGEGRLGEGVTGRRRDWETGGLWDEETERRDELIR
jgi:hypothetical protein